MQSLDAMNKISMFPYFPEVLKEHFIINKLRTLIRLNTEHLQILELKNIKHFKQTDKHTQLQMSN